MPSGYDEMSERAHSDYAGGTTQQNANRALLRSAMEAEGFDRESQRVVALRLQRLEAVSHHERALRAASARNEVSYTSPPTPKRLYCGMFIRLGYDIEFDIPAPVAMVSMLSVHPSRLPDLRAPDHMQIDPAVPLTNYMDGFGNLCTRFVAPPGNASSVCRHPHRRPRKARSGFARCPRTPGRRTSERDSHLSAKQPLLRGRSPVEHRLGAFRRHPSRLGTGASRLRLGELQGDLRLPARAALSHSTRRVH